MDRPGHRWVKRQLRLRGLEGVREEAEKSVSHPKRLYVPLAVTPPKKAGVRFDLIHSDEVATVEGRLQVVQCYV